MVDDLNPQDHDITDSTGLGSDAMQAPSATSGKVEPPAVTAARKALVTEILSEIKKDKEHWKPAFDRMRFCMKIAANGTSDATRAKAENGDYVVPIINRAIGQAVASQYAKNPRAVAKRKQKLMYKLWDGDAETLTAAFQAIQPPQPPAPQMGHNGGPPMTPPVDPNAPPWQPDPNALALLQEVQQVKAELLQYDRMAKTMELLFLYFLEEQDMGYKEMFKALVRRAKVCGVGYVDLGFQRQLKRNPDIAAQIADISSQIAAIEAGLAQVESGEIEQDTASAEDLRLMMEDLQSKVEVVVREGPTLSFPRATSIIPDRRCKHLKTFAGARRVAREFEMSPEEILETYKIDVGKQFTAYNQGGQNSDAAGNLAHVYVVQDKRKQQTFVVCEGYPDFLEVPKEPDVKIERFWTLFPLVYNEVETEGDDAVSIFPPPDAWNARHMQTEYNSGRQGLREHKIAARPGYVSPAGRLDEVDKQKLANRQGFEVIDLKALATGEKLEDMLMAIPVSGIDPAMYETETIYNDMQRAIGTQAADLGGNSGNTATESSIAENSRATASGSDTDDLDTMLSALARAMGQLMLTELSKETVLEIAGPGAVWPDLPPTREQIVKDLILEIEAGSSGKPNNAATLANYERAMPWLVQLPGVNPKPLAKKALAALDIDSDDTIVEGAPSITALNQMMGHPQQPGVGAGPNAPSDQGAHGGNNAQKAEHPSGPGPQPAFPAPQAPVH